MHIADPDSIRPILSFPHQGVRIQVTETWLHGQKVYTAWVDYAQGSAVAVPKACSRSEAMRRAKAWVKRKFE